MQAARFADSRANVHIVNPNGTANVVATAIKIDPLLQTELCRRRRLGQRDKFFRIARSRMLAGVFRNAANPFVQMRKEAAQELAQRAAHREKINRDGFRLGAREGETRQVRFAPLTEKAKKIGSDERAETVRNDDDSVVRTPAVVLAAGAKMMKQSSVAFDDLRARRGARGRGTKVIVHVQNGVENGTQIFDEQTRQNSGRAGKNSTEGEQLTAARRHERQLI